MKSFHLEVMCLDCDLTGLRDDRQRLRKLLLHIANKLRDRQLLPPGDGAPLATYFDEDATRAWKHDDVVDFVQKAAQIATNAVTAEAQGKDTDAVAHWRQLFN